MNTKITQNNNYRSTLKEIITTIKKSRYQMLKKVNKETVQLYWSIGKTVSIKTNQHRWGKSIVEKLAKDLQSEFPGVRGFSARNIWNMKKFYETYAQNRKLQPLVAEIGWVHNCLIIEKCKDEKKRLFYLQQTKEKGWSKNDLIEKINSHYYENKLLSQNNFPETVSEELKADVAWEFIDDYSIELLNPD